MKRLSLLALALLPLVVAAQDKNFGTKPDVIKSAAQSPSGFGLMPFFQMLIALGVVLAIIKFALPKVLAKVNKKLVTSGSAIRVEESAQFAGGSLYIVNARGKSILLSVSNTGVQYLTDLTPQPEPAIKETFLDLLENEDARLAALEQPVIEPEPIAEPEPITALVEMTEPVVEEPLLDDVHRLLAEAHAKREAAAAAKQIEPEQAPLQEFKTRLPENVQPLPSVLPEAQPWQPRKITENDRADEIEAVLRRLQQLS